MTSKYQPISEVEQFEDIDIEKFRRASTSDSLGSSSTLLEEEEGSLNVDLKRKCDVRRLDLRRWDPNGIWVWVLHGILLSVSFAFFITAWFMSGNVGSTLDYVERFSAWSPAAEAVQYKTFKYNDTMGEHSPYVGKGPAVDAAWNAISYDIGDQMIRPEDLPLIDMPSSSLMVKHPVTGVEGYRVGLEVFHQLHCINLLRQVTYKEHYQAIGNGNFAVDEKELQLHTDHCLEILRLNVQCSADVGVFTFYMLDGDPLPWPELDSWHTCRNFDAVKDWAIENSVGNMERPDIPDGGM